MDRSTEPTPFAIEPTSAPLAERAVALGPIRALVVDDSKPMQIFTKRMLEVAGAAEVWCVDGGSQAIGAIDARKGAFDILLIDIQMPHMDGHELVRALRDAGVELPIIAVTAHNTPEDRAAIAASGFDGHLVKPFNQAALTHAVRGALEARA